MRTTKNENIKLQIEMSEQVTARACSLSGRIISIHIEATYQIFTRVCGFLYLHILKTNFNKIIDNNLTPLKRFLCTRFSNLKTLVVNIVGDPLRNIPTPEVKRAKHDWYVGDCYQSVTTQGSERQDRRLATDNKRSIKSEIVLTVNTI